MINKRQQEACQWLDRLEELAIQNNIKLRLLDSIRDCKKALESELTEAEWRQNCTEIGELLYQIEKQLNPRREQSELESDIAQRVSEFLKRCGNANEMAQNEYCGGSTFYIQAAENSMQEMTNVKANFDEVTNQERLQGVFRQIGQKYKQQIDEQQERYAKAVDQNYQDAFDRMKGLLSATGYDRGAKSKFFNAYYANQDTMTGAAQEYVRSREKGESSIVKVAEELRTPLTELLLKLKKKRLLLKWLPAIILVCCLLISVIVIYSAAMATVDQLAEVAQKVDEEEQMNISDFLEIVNVLENLSQSGEGVAETFLLEVGLPLLLLGILLYFLWCKAVNRRYRAWVIKEAGALLSVSVGRFCSENTLQMAVQESYRQTSGYLRNQYEELLTELIPNLLPEEEKEDSNKVIFATLCTEWENIRRKAVEN